MWVWAKRDTEAPKFGGRFCVLAQYTVECSVEFEPSQSWVLTESVLGFYSPLSFMHEGGGLCGPRQDSGNSVLTGYT